MTNTRGCPLTITTSFFGTVATRKSFPCTKPPNGSGFVTTWTMCSGLKTAEPGAVSDRYLIVNTCGVFSNSPVTFAHVMYARPSGPTVTSLNWTSLSTVEIGIGSVQVTRFASHRTALIETAVYPSGAFWSKAKSEYVTQT